MKVISIHQNRSQSLATNSRASRPRELVRDSDRSSSKKRNPSDNEDYLGMALWFTRELQREFVGPSSISMRD